MLYMRTYRGAKDHAPNPKEFNLAEWLDNLRLGGYAEVPPPAAAILRTGWLDVIRKQAMPFLQIKFHCQPSQRQRSRDQPRTPRCSRRRS